MSRNLQKHKNNYKVKLSSCFIQVDNADDGATTLRSFKKVAITALFVF